MKRGGCIGMLVLLVTTFSGPVAAELPAGVVESDERTRMADAHFRRGRAAFLQRDFHAAGRAFDDAYAMMPHHDALWNAAQSWESGGEIARAANRYAAYLRVAPPTAPDRAQATASLAALSRRLGRIHVFAPPTEQPHIDGDAVTSDVVYVYPGTHVVTIQRGQGTVEREVSVAALEDQSVSFVGATIAGNTPERANGLPLTESAPRPPPTDSPPRASVRILPPWTVLGGAGLTVIGAGAATFFGFRSLSTKRDFDRHPSTDLLTSGRDDQTYANVALGVTLGLAVITTCAALFFVDWRAAPTVSPARAIR